MNMSFVRPGRPKEDDAPRLPSDACAPAEIIDEQLHHRLVLGQVGKQQSCKSVFSTWVPDMDPVPLGIPTAENTELMASSGSGTASTQLMTPSSSNQTQCTTNRTFDHGLLVTDNPSMQMSNLWSNCSMMKSERFEINELADLRAKCVVLEAENSEFAQQLAHLRDKCSTMETQTICKSLEGDIYETTVVETLRHKIEMLETEKSGLVLQVDQLRVMCAALEAEKRDLNEIDDLQAKCKASEAEKWGLLLQVDQLWTMCKELESEKNDNAEVRSLRDKCRALDAEKSGLALQIDQFKAMCNALEAVQVDQLQSLCSAFTAERGDPVELQKIQTKCRDLEAERDKLQLQVDEFRNMWSAVETPVNKFDAPLEFPAKCNRLEIKEDDLELKRNQFQCSCKSTSKVEELDEFDQARFGVLEAEQIGFGLHANQVRAVCDMPDRKTGFLMDDTVEAEHVGAALQRDQPQNLRMKKLQEKNSALENENLERDKIIELGELWARCGSLEIANNELTMQVNLFWSICMMLASKCRFGSNGDGMVKIDQCQSLSNPMQADENKCTDIEIFLANCGALETNDVQLASHVNQLCAMCIISHWKQLTIHRRTKCGWSASDSEFNL